MAVRPTMSVLIASLRGMTAAGASDHNAGGADYWTAEQLQDALDRTRVEVYDELLLSIQEPNSGGTAHWHEYRTARGNLEQTDGGTARFILRDSTGATAGTALWSADYARGVVTFPASTGGTAYYADYRSYDLNAAAADVWRQKAGMWASRFDISADGSTLRRSQTIQHALQMADAYARMGGPVVVSAARGDVR